MGVEENECNVLHCSPSGSWSARAVSTGTAGTGSAEQKSEFQDVHSVLLWAFWKKKKIHSVLSIIAEMMLVLHLYLIQQLYFLSHFYFSFE